MDSQPSALSVRRQHTSYLYLATARLWAVDGFGVADQADGDVRRKEPLLGRVPLDWKHQGSQLKGSYIF
jgi:hypothetical protein